jgi:L-lactate dehydrogenase complex protein LldE
MIDQTGRVLYARPVRVALFVTCLADTLQPSVGRATVAVLERLGVDVAFPRAQTCCGQLHLNAGYDEVAAKLGQRFVDVFAGFDAVVAPSGSCVAHVREHVARHARDPAGVALRTWELSELLVDRLGVVDVGSGYSGSVTYHPTCHSLRTLRLGDRPESLLRAVRGLELRPLGDATECCGFGGLFAIRNADVSTAMLADKLRRVEETGADAVCACDASCLLHVRGGLERRGSPVHAVHLAEVLAS